MTEIPKYVVLEKMVGETPLFCAEAYRAEHPELKGVPMAYAGRLDPMASGKLLILLGEECKNQTDYHGLDKEYEFSVLLGIESDSLDVMGRLLTPISVNKSSDCVRLGMAARDDQSEDLIAGCQSNIETVCAEFIGQIELPYPRFSAKTVQGKPLHTWTVEGRLDEIIIPTKESEIYELEFIKLENLTRHEVVEQALA
jgi:tRNA pseudouridine55 synthase